MAKKRNPGAKDPATKNTLNPPGGGHPPDTPANPRQGKGTDTGQFTGEGRPALQKK
jgi:hypothetical protein